jgi:chromosome segregation protein
VRLRQIKLAGFKSFVDPTQIDVPGRLVGVVGPNGCGKSNVIDAVRWVLGESKAAELRGESMMDVIFNGAANRKPAGRASVELVFDNTEGRIGGEWGRFAELSVKRVLTRDNTSSYLINNQQVRRRDVHDLFLGTGLGPRAYAIIGQGMISRIVEARPEDLRVFLEEAAGVTKYKERRRETENRLSDTRDNLVRVEDVIRELDGQIERLQRQAEVAKEYRALTEQHGLRQSLLWLTRQRQSQDEQAAVVRDITQTELAVEEQTAALRAVELQLEQEREGQYQANDQASAAHAELSRINTEIGRLEAEIRGTVEARARLNAQIDSLGRSRDRRLEDASQMQARHVEIAAAIELVTERLEEASMQVEAQETVIPDLEAQADAAREALTAARSRASSAQLEINAAGQQMQMHERALQNQLLRRERLQDEQSRLGTPDAGRLETLQQEVSGLQEELDQIELQGAAAEESLEQLQGQRQDLGNQRQQASAELHKLEARQHAVQETLDNMEADEKLDPWLKAQGLDGLPRLLRRLEVESGWETAVEAVLRERIEAIEVGRLEPMVAFGRLTPPSRISFFSPSATDAAPGEPPSRPWQRLLDLVSVRQSDDRAAVQSVLTDWLAGVFVQPDLDKSVAARHELHPGEQFVVAAGHLVSRHGLRFFAADDRKSGLLARKREAENLERQIRAQRLIDGQAAEALARCEAQLRQSQAQAQSARESGGRLRTRLHERQLEAVRLGELIDRIRHRGGQIDSELDALGREEADSNRQRDEAEARFAELDEMLGAIQEAVETARLQEEQTSSVLRSARDRLRERETDKQRSHFELVTAQQRLADMTHAIGVAQTDAQRFADERDDAALEAAKLDESAALGGLDDWLTQRINAENALNQARAAVDALMQKIRFNEEQRQKLERGLQPRRDKITELRLKEQAARLAAEQFAQLLADAGADPEALESQRQGLPGAAAQEAEIARLARAIADLGAVNLAALEELDAASQRHGFLQSQCQDLNAAVQTLEDAIRKIDLETRSLLQATFDQVNRHFGELFPKLFGGGDARLVMTGEEILDAGVQVIAQPPGKRNSSIHLLSGGEKALTATALVFAMFKLNPAPFCLLDEVDAPLDDTNTERFSQLVKSMTDATQFLYITHNRIAMEIAEQLIGVTMQEQGVSRIVAVDIDSAIKLTADA